MNYSAYLMKHVTIYTKNSTMLSGTLISYQPMLVLDTNESCSDLDVDRIELQGTLTEPFALLT